MNRLIARCVVVAASFALLAQSRVVAQSSLVTAPPSYTGGASPLSQPFETRIQPTSCAAKPFTPVMLGDFTGPLGTLHNVVDFTLGTTIELSRSATIGVGVVVPVTGPKPIDI